TYDDFSWIVFYGVGFFFVVTMMIYVFPRLFGFKKPLPITNTTPRPKVAFPSWFWWGGGVWLVVLGFLLGHFSSPKWLLNWAYVPLYWGLTFYWMALFINEPEANLCSITIQELVGIGVSSTAGWLILNT
ncbi:MAG: hypothetical protein IPO27_12580, partial [Bacteroidetes bacterium]|nr:hypothetical protein [Bacteroidota bacterium]